MPELNPTTTSGSKTPSSTRTLKRLDFKQVLRPADGLGRIAESPLPELSLTTTSGPKTSPSTRTLEGFDFKQVLRAADGFGRIATKTKTLPAKPDVLINGKDTEKEVCILVQELAFTFCQFHV